MELVTRKGKKLKETGKLFRKNIKIKGIYINPRLKANYIVSQRKAFCRQRIAGPTCARKRTVETSL